MHRSEEYKGFCRTVASRPLRVVKNRFHLNVAMPRRGVRVENSAHVRHVCELKNSGIDRHFLREANISLCNLQNKEKKKENRAGEKRDTKGCAHKGNAVTNGAIISGV